MFAVSIVHTCPSVPSGKQKPELSSLVSHTSGVFGEHILKMSHHTHYGAVVNANVIMKQAPRSFGLKSGPSASKF